MDKWVWTREYGQQHRVDDMARRPWSVRMKSPWRKNKTLRKLHDVFISTIYLESLTWQGLVPKQLIEEQRESFQDCQQAHLVLYDTFGLCLLLPSFMHIRTETSTGRMTSTQSKVLDSWICCLPLQKWGQRVAEPVVGSQSRSELNAEGALEMKSQTTSNFNQMFTTHSRRYSNKTR